MDAPKISVIIPMYNAEKFIRQCLISVLASKFADYEVLVVDDCSTDNSLAEVEKLAPHFNGRLKIFRTEKNSGGAGIPRNIALKNSSGKYLCFVDADDMIFPTAFDNFLTVAEDFQADVVHMEKFYFCKDTDGNFRREELVLQKYEAGEAVNVPTPEPDDLRGRIQRMLEGRFIWMPWGKLFRREFVVANEIEFVDVPITADLLFWFKCLCLAKKYVRAPQVTNIYRRGHASASNIGISSSKGVHLWLDVCLKNIALIDEFTGGLEFFRNNPDVRHDTLKFFIGKYFELIEDLFTTVQPHEVPKIFFNALENPALNQHGKNLVAAYLFSERALNK